MRQPVSWVIFPHQTVFFDDQTPKTVFKLLRTSHQDVMLCLKKKEIHQKEKWSDEFMIQKEKQKLRWEKEDQTQRKKLESAAARWMRASRSWLVNGWLSHLKKHEWSNLSRFFSRFWKWNMWRKPPVWMWKHLWNIIEQSDLEQQIQNLNGTVKFGSNKWIVFFKTFRFQLFFEILFSADSWHCRHRIPGHSPYGSTWLAFGYHQFRIEGFG